jgi:hypothetical protein
MPYITEHADGAGDSVQTLHDPDSQMSYDLANETMWKVVRDPTSGDYFVDSITADDNVKPRWVKHLIKRKKARPTLASELDLCLPQPKKQHV